MKARATRNRRGRRYLGPTCLAGSGPANLAMVDRSMRKGRRQIARKDRRTPRPLRLRILQRSLDRPVHYVEIRLSVDDAEFRRYWHGLDAQVIRAVHIPRDMLAGCAPANS